MRTVSPLHVARIIRDERLKDVSRFDQSRQRFDISALLLIDNREVGVTDIKIALHCALLRSMAANRSAIARPSREAVTDGGFEPVSERQLACTLRLP